VRSLVKALACLVVWPATGVAQDAAALILDRLGPVQADEFRLDSNRLIIRGNVRGDLLAPDDQIVCDVEQGVLAVTNHAKRTDDRFVVGVAGCAALVGELRRNGRLR
jgi:hypothetical protein